MRLMAFLTSFRVFGGNGPMTELNDRYGAGNFRRLTKGALVLDVNEVTR
jgi:hypothetical protein